MNVTAVETRAWTKDDGTEVTTYWVTLEGREKNVPCYDAKAAALKLDAPLPEGWEIKQAKSSGKDFLAPPRAPSGGGGWKQAPRDEAGMSWGNALNVSVAALASGLNIDEVLHNARIIFQEGRALLGTAGGAPASPPLSAPPATTEGGTTGAVTGEGTASVPPSLSAEEFFGKPCECGGTIWKPAPVGGFSVCVGCLNAEKTKQVQL